MSAQASQQQLSRGMIDICGYFTLPHGCIKEVANVSQRPLVALQQKSPWPKEAFTISIHHDFIRGVFTCRKLCRKGVILRCWAGKRTDPRLACAPGKTFSFKWTALVLHSFPVIYCSVPTPKHERLLLHPAHLAVHFLHCVLNAQRRAALLDWHTSICISSHYLHTDSQKNNTDWRRNLCKEFLCFTKVMCSYLIKLHKRSQDDLM